MAVLEARNVSKRFGGIAAVDGMSFSVDCGRNPWPDRAEWRGQDDDVRSAGRIGRRQTSGEIRLMGQDVTTSPAHRRLAGGMGRTFQIPRPFPELSLLDNMLLARQDQTGERLWANFTAPRRIAAEERAARDKALGLLDLVALRRLADEPARVLSGGQRKLLELARVMMADPKVVLLDEPAAGVNPSLLEVLIDRIREINAQRRHLCADRA